ncbi:proprotein convertase subtilisin/kexin type 1 inhibitor, like isoform X2 [Gadus chalcogrammus]|uniref:proprotein convertase subtilisin/kexin type 1 inhibitor, like isoform X2 n=1 Tax=Gadus chalcogrammus TaxID=1042646 RepID=UPI0024C4359C|nr:proprotein convertase subtilisin/kexin type 1 inhibitor, like isoform X2 [Gadus chalcogrammus]
MLGPLCLLCVTACSVLNAKSLPAARPGGRGLEGQGAAARRLRRDLRDLLPNEAEMMSYPVQRGDADYQQTEWRRSLDDALQRLVESNQRREQEQEGEAEGAGLVNPGDMDVMDVVEEEEEEGGPFQRLATQDYDDTGRGMSPGNSQAASWALLERMDPRLARTLLERSRQNQLDQRDPRPRPPSPRGGDPDLLRYLVARILGSMAPAKSRSRRDVAAPRPVSPAHTRSRRSLDNASPPLPSSDSPLLRVKRLRLEGEEEDGGRGGEGPDTIATAQEEEGSRRRRRRAAVTFNPRVLAQQLLQVLQE